MRLMILYVLLVHFGYPWHTFVLVTIFAGFCEMWDIYKLSKLKGH